MELLQSAMYKELVDWEAKQPDKALAVVMGCDSATEQSGIGQMITSYAVYREASEKSTGIANYVKFYAECTRSLFTR